MPQKQKLKGLENVPALCHQEEPASSPCGQPAAEPEDYVTPVIAHPVENEGQITAPSAPGSDGKNSMAMHIVTDSLQFKLDTVVDQSQAAIELAAKLELALALLEKTQNKLERTMIELGQVRAQLDLQLEMQKAMQEQMHKTMQAEMQKAVQENMQAHMQKTMQAEMQKAVQENMQAGMPGQMPEQVQQKRQV